MKGYLTEHDPLKKRIFVNMHRSARHKGFLKLAVICWFLWFALSPCYVKASFLATLNADYNKPLNKTRALAPFSVCHVIGEGKTVVNFQKIEINVRAGSLLTLTYYPNEILFDTIEVPPYLGNSPPFYILYKRLKLDCC